jgi:hypothetical protein
MASCLSLNASMIPLMPSPGIPKTVSIPQSSNTSTIASEAFFAICLLSPHVAYVSARRDLSGTPFNLIGLSTYKLTGAATREGISVGMKQAIKLLGSLALLGLISLAMAMSSVAGKWNGRIQLDMSKMPKAKNAEQQKVMDNAFKVVKNILITLISKRTRPTRPPSLAGPLSRRRMEPGLKTATQCPSLRPIGRLARSALRCLT